MNNIVYNTKKEKLKNRLSNLNQKQFDKEILKSIGNDKLEAFTMWQDPTIEEYQKEIARLNKIIDELEEYIQLKIIRSENESDYIIDEGDIKELYYKLKELKEEGKE